MKMDRRKFLKGMFGFAAIAAAPVAVNKVVFDMGRCRFLPHGFRYFGVDWGREDVGIDGGYWASDELFKYLREPLGPIVRYLEQPRQQGKSAAIKWRDITLDDLKGGEIGKVDGFRFIESEALDDSVLMGSSREIFSLNGNAILESKRQIAERMGFELPMQKRESKLISMITHIHTPDRKCLVEKA